MSLGAGIRLGPYEIVSALGAGGMGDVYEARDTRLDRTVAIKQLTLQDLDARLREVKALQEMSIAPLGAGVKDVAIAQLNGRTHNTIWSKVAEDGDETATRIIEFVRAHTSVKRSQQQ